jgi:hypothetical protein
MESAMNTPVSLHSLEVTNFRNFQHLKIDQVDRVNLVVGKNNVGKTSLLEALWLYSNNGSPSVIQQILRRRDELFRRTGYRTGTYVLRDQEDVSVIASALKHLFFGHPNINGKSPLIQISDALGKSDKLVITLRWYASPLDADKGQRNLPLFDEISTPAEDPILCLVIINGQAEIVIPLSRFLSRSSEMIEPAQTPCVFIPANGLSTSLLGQFWDSIVLSDSESEVLDALKIIEPTVERISFIGNSQDDRIRVPIARLTSFEEPLPLRSLGDGMNRLLGIGLAVANAKDGMLLIDEIDTGLHYSVLPDMWRLIFRVSQRLNVQVFATTHSLDCIQAFQQATDDTAYKSSLLISLRQKLERGGKEKRGEIVALVFDKDNLKTITQDNIEVR